jgi:hypothetical protein
MVDAICKINITQLERVNTFQTRNIESKLVRIGASLMVGIDATLRTKKVPSSHSIKLIKT